MGVVIVVLGVIGIGVALAAIVDVAVDGARGRRYLDIVIVIAAAAVTIWLLITYGNVLMQ